MQKIKTATGKEFDCDSLTMIQNPRRVYITLHGVSIAEVAAVFSDPRETVQLYYGDQYLANHTTLLGIIPEDGMVRVNLTKE